MHPPSKAGVQYCTQTASMPGLALMEDPRQQLAVQQATHHDMNGASSPLGIVTEQVCCAAKHCVPVRNSVCVFKG